ncbi:hypothetical protein KC909_05385 [Candidatus Dojkabacteria bacterium]|uniref:7 transmembrane helices usually fused to an inactive transglutaminase domain-containing protein n=1 Tax=Candidatus Dojkabacteria bacterium TaxID=2099670 RepID=A0A955RJG6_9BACT|nr:hypothetical protein [Candidatus Dojkabacteria bacterium]
MNSFSDLVVQFDIDMNVIITLLFLPLIVTIVGFARYVIGVRSLGIYAPIVLTFIFYEFGITKPGSIESDVFQGLKFGLFLTFIIFLTTVVSYKILKKWALHYYSKLSIVITSVVLSIIGVLVIADLTNNPGILKISVFSLILIASVSERYMNLFAFNKSTKKAVFLSLETLGISILCYLVISLSSLQNLLLDYPLLILLNLPIAYMIGRFSGLRLTEYYRFRDVLDTEEE